MCHMMRYIFLSSRLAPNRYFDETPNYICQKVLEITLTTWAQARLTIYSESFKSWGGWGDSYETPCNLCYNHGFPWVVFIGSVVVYTPRSLC